MSDETHSPDVFEPVEVDLKNPVLAAFVAWLWPGAGHLYQGRNGKGILYMVCILGTYFFGLTLGGGHVVYASWTKTDKRLPYLCQVGVGLAALPALLQSHQVRRGHKPLWGGIMAPPRQPVQPSHRDELAEWHETYHYRFELGTVFTMIAGLLNILAIYDAGAGPVFVAPGEESEKPPLDEKKSKE